MEVIMLNIVICEDNTEYRNLLNKYVSEILKNEDILGKIELTCNDPNLVLQSLYKKTQNVFFLDIDLKSHMNGYELAENIKKNINKPYIVFITEHLEFVFQTFKIRPFDFLPKPVGYDILKNCLIDIYHDHLKNNSLPENSPAADRITIKSGTSIFYIYKQDIIFIEKIQNKAILHTCNKEISCYEALEYFEDLLKEDSSFVRCHKSFIANKTHIQEIKLNTMEIEFNTGDKCYIGRKYKTSLQLNI